jgi:hypothetical protein
MTALIDVAVVAIKAIIDIVRTNVSPEDFNKLQQDIKIEVDRIANVQAIDEQTEKKILEGIE